jgi:hypothetical protein
MGRWTGEAVMLTKTARYELEIDIYRVSGEEKRRFKKGLRMGSC